MSTEDKYACAELIQSWGLYRDQLRWPELRDTFVGHGTIAVSWFRGSFADFVARCAARSPERTGRAKHFLSPSVVEVAGDRALAETSTVIRVRQSIGGIAVDLTSYARFLDRFERGEAGWKFVERAAVYEHDRLDPVEPSSAFAALFARGESGQYPNAYRYMALRIHAEGGSLAEPVLTDGAPDTDALRRRYREWLDAAEYP